MSRNSKINATNLDFSTEHTTNNLNDLRAVEVYLNLVKSTGEWNVGGKLWELLTQNQKDMLTKIRRKGIEMIPNRNEKNQPNNLKVAATILKKSNKDNDQDTNISTLSTSTYNL